MNPYLVWDEHTPGAGWRPFAELLEPEVLAERVAVSRQALSAMFGLDEAALPERVVASVLFLGYASRLVGPMLADALQGTVRGAGLADLWWRPVPGGPLPVAVGAVETRPADDLFDVAVLGLVAPLLEAFRARFRLSPQVLWGNVASALGGAAGQLPGGAWPAVAELLRRPPLSGMAVVGHRSLRRRNCCLYYRIPGGGTCGDCVLRRPEPAPGPAR